MKAILKTLLFLVAVVILSQCEKDDPQVTIPDSNFLTALIELGVDTNGDGFISPAEAKMITFLDVDFDSISDMTGINAFIKLDTLYCSYNKLTTLDVSENTALTTLRCFSNQLTSLNISNNTILTMLSCSENQLTSLNISNNTTLTVLSCWGNQLPTLDLSNCTDLTVLSCLENQLTTLDVSGNTILEKLDCRYNQLATLNISNNTALIYLDCSGNQLNALDVSMNTSLEDLSIEDMPSLSMVCVWTMPFPPAGVIVHTYDSPNIYFTTDCSK